MATRAGEDRTESIEIPQVLKEMGMLLYQSTVFLKKARGIFKYEKIQGFQHP